MDVHPCLGSMWPQFDSEFSDHFLGETLSDVLWLSILATSGLAICWSVFWWAIVRHGENIHDVLASAGFFRTVTVMGVIAATVVLSLSGKLEGNFTGAILSGIVGYVLGQLAGHKNEK